VSATPQAPYVSPDLVTVPKATTAADLKDLNGNLRDVVGSPVAAPAGPITQPVGSAVVVTVKGWWQSATMWLSAAGILEAVEDAVVNVLVPIINDPAPIDWQTLPSKLFRPALKAGFFAWIAYRRKTDNTVVR
jgi:hypothetical protein